MDEEELSEIFLPSNNKYIKEFLTFPQEKQIQIITLGLSTFIYSSQKFKTVIDGEKEDIIDKLNNSHQKEIDELKIIQSNLKSQVVKLKKENNEQERIYKDTFNEKINKEKLIIKDNLDRLHGEKIIELEKKIKTLDDGINSLRETRLSQQQEYYEKLLQEKQKSTEEINKIRIDYQNRIEDYRKQMEQFQKINQNSTLKGQKGEDIMYNILIEHFPGCQIDTHTSKEGHKGDFSIIDDTHRGMIESKNYKKNVPKNEIKKFYSDIENNNDIDFAILCSLKSGVANKPNDFTLEFINGKPVIFLHKVKDNKKSVLLAYTICKLILKNMQCFDITKEENQIKIKQLVKAYLQNHKKIVSQVNDFNKIMNTMLSKQIDDFKSMLDLINITY